MNRFFLCSALFSGASASSGTVSHYMREANDHEFAGTITDQDTGAKSHECALCEVHSEKMLIKYDTNVPEHDNFHCTKDEGYSTCTCQCSFHHENGLGASCKSYQHTCPNSDWSNLPSDSQERDCELLPEEERFRNIASCNDITTSGGGGGECAQDGDWPATASGSSAVIDCPNGQFGSKTRQCVLGSWKPGVTSTCESCDDREAAICVAGQQLSGCTGTSGGSCSDCTAVANAVFTTVGNCDFDCDDGFTKNGNGCVRNQCSADGIWEATDTSSTVQKACPDGQVGAGKQRYCSADSQWGDVTEQDDNDVCRLPGSNAHCVELYGAEYYYNGNRHFTATKCSKKCPAASGYDATLAGDVAYKACTNSLQIGAGYKRVCSLAGSWDGPQYHRDHPNDVCRLPGSDAQCQAKYDSSYFHNTDASGHCSKRCAGSAGYPTTFDGQWAQIDCPSNENGAGKQRLCDNGQWSAISEQDVNDPCTCIDGYSRGSSGTCNADPASDSDCVALHGQHWFWNSGANTCSKRCYTAHGYPTTFAGETGWKSCGSNKVGAGTVKDCSSTGSWASSYRAADANDLCRDPTSNSECASVNAAKPYWRGNPYNRCEAKCPAQGNYAATWAGSTASGGACPDGHIGSIQKVCSGSGSWGSETNTCAACTGSTYFDGTQTCQNCPTNNNCGVGQQFSGCGGTSAGSCSACTSKPSNSHYTTANSCNWECTSKPSNSHYTTANSCNWECDTGYTNPNGRRLLSDFELDQMQLGRGGASSTPTCNQISCTRGKYVNGDLGECQDCQQGRFMSTNGNTYPTTCTVCPAGQTTSGTGSTGRRLWGSDRERFGSTTTTSSSSSTSQSACSASHCTTTSHYNCNGPRGCRTIYSTSCPR